MPTILTTKAIEDGTYIVTAVFTNEDGDAVTPNAGTFTWAMTTEHGVAIVDGDVTECIEAAEASTLNIVLSVTDLAVTETFEPWRIVKTYAEYDATAGNDLPTIGVAKFQIEKTVATAEVVTIQEAKEHMRIDAANTNHDNYIARCIKVARRYAENYQHRKYITQTVTKYYQDWTGRDTDIYFDGGWYLPYGQLQSVTSIKYTNTAGTQSTWANTEYDIDIYNDPGCVRLAYDKTFPTVTLKPTNPIEIIYCCGYGATGESVPHETKSAVLIFAADLFEQRESFVIGQTMLTPWKMGNIGIVHQLLDLNKLWKFST